MRGKLSLQMGPGTRGKTREMWQKLRQRKEGKAAVTTQRWRPVLGDSEKEEGSAAPEKSCGGGGGGRKQHVCP